MIEELPVSPTSRFARPALLLGVCVLVVALLLLPLSWDRAGLNGPSGLVLAASVCLATGWAAVGVAQSLGPHVSPLVTMLIGMMIRLLPPLAICTVLAAQGGGQTRLPFIAYLLSFYFVTLGVETWLAVSRVADRATHGNPGSR